jgi:hypothetical protein
MYTFSRVSLRILPYLLALTVAACATVPKEVVELSYVVGQDLKELHQSYRTLVRTHFDGLRAQTDQFLQTRWTPLWLKEFIADGELIQKVKGSDPVQVLEDVQLWTEVAIEEIQDKRRELIEPIDKDEQDLLTSVDEAFARVTVANSTITAHLNSLRQVQEVQDQALQALRLGDLRGKITDALVRASEKSKEALEKLAKVEGVVDTLNVEKDALKSLLKRRTEQ